MSQEIIFSNLEKFEKTKQNFINEGIDKVHIITDFDGTLTKANYNGVKRPSIISVLRSKEFNYLGDDYQAKAHELFDYYHPIEIDESISLDIRKQKMDDWWKAHLTLLIESGLKFEHIEKVANSGIIELKNNCKELLNFTKEKNIPVVIMSANGIGDTLSIYLDYNKCLFDNIYTITNHFKFNDSGFASEYFTPFVHSLNKDETILEDFPEIFKIIENRKNVILIGDGIGDPGMSDGFNHDNIIKIGFINEPDMEKRKNIIESYKAKYDVLVVGDEDVDFVYNFIKEIK